MLSTNSSFTSRTKVERFVEKKALDRHNGKGKKREDYKNRNIFENFFLSLSLLRHKTALYTAMKFQLDLA